jgi:hypothetical protein
MKHLTIDKNELFTNYVTITASKSCYKEKELLHGCNRGQVNSRAWMKYEEVTVFM